MYTKQALARSAKLTGASVYFWMDGQSAYATGKSTAGTLDWSRGGGAPAACCGEKTPKQADLGSGGCRKDILGRENASGASGKREAQMHLLVGTSQPPAADRVSDRRALRSG